MDFNKSTVKTSKQTLTSSYVEVTEASGATSNVTLWSDVAWQLDVGNTVAGDSTAVSIPEDMVVTLDPAPLNPVSAKGTGTLNIIRS